MGLANSSQKDEQIIESLDKFMDNRFHIVFEKLLENSIVFKETHDDFHYGQVITLQNINIKEYFLELKELTFTTELEAKKTMV